MAQFVAALLCSASTRTWTKNENEDHVLFVICQPGGAKPFLWTNQQAPMQSMRDDDQVKPLPVVRGAILNSPKMVSYPWGQVKEFVHVIPHKPEFGEGLLMSVANKMSIPVKQQVQQQEPEKKSARGPPPQAAKPPPQAAKPPPTSAPRQMPERSPTKREHPSVTPRDPAIDSISLSEISVSFMNEPDSDLLFSTVPQTARGRPPPRLPPSRVTPLTQSENSLLDDISKSFDKLSAIVDDFDDPQQQQVQQPGISSAFSEFGIASFFGMELEYEDDKFKPPKVERKKPPPTLPRPPPRAQPTLTTTTTTSVVSPRPTAQTGIPEVIWDSQGVKLMKNDWMDLVGKGNPAAGVGNGMVTFFANLMNLICKAKKVTPTTMFLSADFYTHITKDATKLFTFVEELDLPSYDRVVLPIRENHNCILAILSEHHLELYDATGASLAGSKGDDNAAKVLSKFFKEFLKSAKKESRARKGITAKKWDALKLIPMLDYPIQKRQVDGPIFAMYFASLIFDKKPVMISTDGRTKLANKIIELMNSVKPVDNMIAREIGALADSAPPLEVDQPPPQEEKKRRKTFSPGSIKPSDVTDG